MSERESAEIWKLLSKVRFMEAQIANLQERVLRLEGRRTAGEQSDTRSGRGFTFAPEREGTYGGYVQVYESSAGSRPCVWIRVAEPATTREGAEADDATVHLTVEDAREFAEDILRICANHYQLRSGEEG